ncbi:hypothetical protein F4810DRAFT_696179 [Camillea tinctor]|nr:hypothetical protein F4810DRAFT_696179 [Camillea tinctor]
MARVSNTLESVVETCRQGFLTSVTFRTEKWKLSQLHGLYQLLLDLRGDILEALSQDFNITKAAYETELAIVLRDIANHYLNAQNNLIIPPWKATNKPVSVHLPAGVSIILSKSSNPLRFGLAPLAACIVAGNSTILGTESTNSRFFTLLSEKISHYLDSETVHVMQGFRLEDLASTKVDRIFILDEKPDRYGNILSMPNASFQSTILGFSLAIVDDGEKMVHKVTEEIWHSFTKAESLTPERLTAFFVRKDHRETFTKVFKEHGRQYSSSNIAAEEITKEGFRHWESGVYQCELVQLLQNSGNRRAPLFSALNTARNSGILLILFYTSLEQVMDALSTLEIIPLQIALLSPDSRSTASYVEKWTKSKAFSVGSIRSIVPVCMPPRTLLLEHSETLFPATLFGEARAISSGIRETPLSISTALLYGKEVVKPVPSDPNQTMEFFGYMNRVFKLLGVALGCFALGGAWFRWFR